jgi:hypothetical protein
MTGVQRFVGFVIVPMGILLGIFFGYSMAGKASWSDTMAMIMLFAMIWFAVSLIEFLAHWIAEVLPEMWRMIANVEREDEYGNTEIPLERDGRVWGKVVLFSEQKERRRDYGGKKFWHWLKAIREKHHGQVAARFPTGD